MTAQVITIYVVKGYREGKLISTTYCINKTIAKEVVNNAKDFSIEKTEIEENSLIVDLF